ncbi:MAG: hypothetical protein ACR2JY_21895 [Chloroflexota bacterium]
MVPALLDQVRATWQSIVPDLRTYTDYRELPDREQVDMVCFFAEADPAWLVGELDDEQQAFGPRYAGDGGRDPATDPGGSAYIHFQNGVRAFVNASKHTMGNFEMDLVGETGRIRVGLNVAELWRPGPDGSAVSRLQVPLTTKGDMVAAPYPSSSASFNRAPPANASTTP